MNLYKEEFNNFMTAAEMWYWMDKVITSCNTKEEKDTAWEYFGPLIENNLNSETEIKATKGLFKAKLYDDYDGIEKNFESINYESKKEVDKEIEEYEEWEINIILKTIGAIVLFIILYFIFGYLYYS